VSPEAALSAVADRPFVVAAVVGVDAAGAVVSHDDGRLTLFFVAPVVAAAGIDTRLGLLVNRLRAGGGVRPRRVGAPTTSKHHPPTEACKTQKELFTVYLN